MYVFIISMEMLTANTVRNVDLQTLIGICVVNKGMGHILLGMDSIPCLNSYNDTILS